MLIHSRENTRNKIERRVLDRRQLDYEFNSPQWIEHVKENYLAWPKTDRRRKARRAGERRQIQQDSPTSSSYIHLDYSSDLLTREERLFFDHLFDKDEKQQS